jgi:hypothetical protein
MRWFWRNDIKLCSGGIGSRDELLELFLLEHIRYIAYILGLISSLQAPQAKQVSSQFIRKPTNLEKSSADDWLIGLSSPYCTFLTASRSGQRWKRGSAINTAWVEPKAYGDLQNPFGLLWVSDPHPCSGWKSVDKKACTVGRNSRVLQYSRF